jgi:hypothetical protein
MLVIGRIKSVETLTANEDLNPFNLSTDEKYHMCVLHKVEHIVGFEGEDISFTNYTF